VDHCPPRCFFIKRNWPEGYAFSCCEICNISTRRDEQIVAVLSRISIIENRNINEEIEWQNLLKGVRNNQPEILEEWCDMPATHLKRFYRESFGNSGDDLRHAGWGATDFGPITISAINRILAKLAESSNQR
jgi:hypothetical protein